MYIYPGEIEMLVEQEASASQRQVYRKLELTLKVVKHAGCCAAALKFLIWVCFFLSSPEGRWLNSMFWGRSIKMSPCGAVKCP